MFTYISRVIQTIPCKTIYKRGDKTQFGNNRLIALLRSLSKIFSNV